MYTMYRWWREGGVIEHGELECFTSLDAMFLDVKEWYNIIKEQI